MINRSLRKLGSLIACSIRYWISDNASSLGATLAFYCAFSLAPLLIILLTIAGWVVGADAAYSQVGNQLTALFGPATAKVLMAAVRSSQQSQGVVATILSVGTLLLGATTVLAALQSALQQIWGAQVASQSGVWSWVKTRLLSFGVILALGFLLLISLTLSTGLAHLREGFARRYTEWVGLVGVLDLTLTLVLVTTLFALIYRYLPSTRLPWKTVVGGGFLTALLFNAGRWGISLYLAKSTQPSAFGAAASFAALLLWLYYSAQIFLLGAEFTACLGELRTKERASPKVSAAARNDTDAHPRSTGGTRK